MDLGSDLGAQALRTGGGGKVSLLNGGDASANGSGSGADPEQQLQPYQQHQQQRDGGGRRRPPSKTSKRVRDDVAAAAAAAAAASDGDGFGGDGGAGHVTRVARPGWLCCPRSAAVLYMLVFGAVCLGVLVCVGVYTAVRISGCWPCEAYEDTAATYVHLPGPMAVLPGPSRSAVATSESCEVQNGSFYDSVVVSGRERGAQFGYVKMLNGPGTTDGQRVLVAPSDSLLLQPASLAMDYCVADIFVADSESGAVFHLSCSDDTPSFDVELCSAYTSSLLEFDATPLALAGHRDCGLDGNFFLFVGGLARDPDSGATLNSTFLQRVEIVEQADGESSGGESARGEAQAQLLPAPADSEFADSLAADAPPLVAPEGLALSLDRGTLLVANTGADELLEVHCLAACDDFANASSIVVTRVTRLAALRRPRGLYTAPSLNTDVFSRVYVVGGDEDAGYVAYYDFVDGRLHTVTTGLRKPVSVFDDVQRPNASGLSTPERMDAEGSVSGLFVADPAADEVLRLRCSHVVDAYVKATI